MNIIVVDNLSSDSAKQTISNVVKLCYVIDPVGAQMAFGHSWFAEEYKYAA